MQIKSYLTYSPDTTLRVIPAAYGNLRLALRLVDPDTGEPIATATVNLPDEPLAPNEIAVKDYSENEGMTQTLALGGIIVGKARRYVRSGFVTIGIHALTEQAEKWLHQDQSA